MTISRKKFRTFFEIFVARPSNPTVETADHWDFADQRYFIITASRVSIAKLRQQLQRKSHIKIELCVKLRVLRLFHVGHVVQIKAKCTFTFLALMVLIRQRMKQLHIVASSRCRQNLKNENLTRREDQITE